MPAKTPQDRKPADDLFSFTAIVEVEVDGKKVKRPKKFTLPSPEDAAPKVDGGISMDAILNPNDDMAQLRLGLAMLLTAGVEPEALAALRSLPTDEMLTTVGEWMTHKPKGSASLGESSSSSD